MAGVLTAFGEAFGASAALAVAAAFAWGALSVVLSPCHLSSIPLVVAYMGEGGAPPAGRRALWISSAFALGILGSISFVGLVTAAAGRMLGDVGRTGNVVLAALFLAVGLDLLGVLPIPALGGLPSRVKRRGAWGALLLGLLFGAALGPCTFAFMAPLLGIAARAGGAGAMGYGVLLLAAYGLGHGAAIVLAGTSLQLVSRWLGWRAGARATAIARRAAGGVVLLGGAYFVWTAV